MQNKFFLLIHKQKAAIILVTGVVLMFGVTACTRDTIEFGTVPENNYTHLAYIDTVGVQLSTVMVDSFATGGATSFLLGKYKDAYLGLVKASAFFQLNKPASIPDIPAGSFYDSLIFIIRPNGYYYGDTTRPQTIYVNELDEAITYAYGTNIYNTSDFSVKPVPLGSRAFYIRPSVDDSLVFRLNDGKGAELFDKIITKSVDVTNIDNFQNYFKGISLTTGANDTTAVFGLKGGTDSSIVMRLCYHSSLPYEERHYIDFPLSANTYAFNQVLTDRSGTGLLSAGSTTGITEIPAAQTNSNAFSQPGTGLNLKMIFPGLKDILMTDNYVSLLRAELIVRPAYLSFDKNKYRLPPSLYLAYTDESNAAGGALPDSTGATMYASPVTDDIYGENNYYRFNITSYISQLLTLPGSEDYGLYLMQNFSATSPEVSRLVLSEPGHSNYITRLQLTVLIVNK